MRGPIDREGLTRREFLGVAAGVAVLAATHRFRVPLGAGATSVDAVELTATDLDAYVREQMRLARVPGLAAAIVKSGEIAWARGYGWANIPRGLRATPNIDFMLASVSKTVTGVAVMQAVEQGLIDLDADVNEVLPFGVRNPRYPDTAITARMLLTHSSSLRDNWKVLSASYVYGDGADSPIRLGDFCREYFSPGGIYYDEGRNFSLSAPLTEYLYCNMAVALAGYMVEAASGIPFDTWCEDRIFIPLGMATTRWHLADLDRRQVAMPYRYERTTDAYRRYGQYGYPDYPDGQLRTSANQLARFLLAFIGWGEYAGVRILQESSVQEMRRSQIPGLVPGQGLIWYVAGSKGMRLMGHNGGDSGVATQMFFRRSDGTGVIMLANGDWHRVRAKWPLMSIFYRLFEEADRLPGVAGEAPARTGVTCNACGPLTS